MPRHSAPLLLAVALVWFAEAVSAQPGPPAALWAHVSGTPRGKIGAERWVQPLRGELFRMDAAALRASLGKVRVAEPALAAQMGTEIELPMPDGTTARFKIVDAPVMAPELAAKFPEIKTYAGQGLDAPSATVRIDLTPAGFHAQILSPNGAVYVDPAYRGDADHHVSYFKRDRSKLLADWECRVLGRGTHTVAGVVESSSGTVLGKTQSGGTLRIYRLAAAATGEYTAYHSPAGTTNATSGLAAIVTAINRVNQLFESELAVRLVLVSNNDLLVYTNADTDPYTNGDPFAMLGQNQANVTGTIGSPNYDIGHVFGTGFSGLASLNCVCDPDYKAQGATCLTPPTGESFWIDLVAHEMGHQFGAEHTFNSPLGSCGLMDQWNSATAFEPGSGSTIMGYAGSCSSDNLQFDSDAYFHGGSLDQIQFFLAGAGGGCASNVFTFNSAPTVNAGPDLAIPASTPFLLTATASDPNGDSISYCWEEMDLGPAASLADVDNGNSPLFRSFRPTNSPVRYFPKLSSVLANTNWNQERLPVQSRTMDFRVTVRDNRTGGGGLADDDMQVTVVGSAGPFVVTSPNTAVSWSGSRTVTWNVAGTTAAPINAYAVNIHLSVDGGLTFPFLLGSNVPNTGLATVVIPSVNSTQARIKVQGAGNIFYDVSDVNFTVSPGQALPLVNLASASLTAETCYPTNGALDPYELVTVDWALINVGTAPITNLVATLLSTNGVYHPTSAQSYGAIPPGAVVANSFSFIPVGTCGGSVTGMLQVVDGAVDLGVMRQVIGLGVVQATVVTQMFSAGAVTISDNQIASPYPSTVAVSGVSGTLLKVTATLGLLSHPFPNDTDILLTGPGGDVMLLGGAGGNEPILNATLTFDDDSGNEPPFDGEIPTGIYNPVDYNLLGHNLSAPAPAWPYGDSVFALANPPNGTWSLFVEDYASPDAGSIAGGWSVSFVSSVVAANCCSSLPSPKFTSTIFSNNTAYLAWQSLPGLLYQVQYRTNLTVGSWQNFGAPILGTGPSLGTNDIVAGSPIRFYRIQVVP